MFCPHCGKQIPDNSYFCLYCGKQIKDTEEKITILKEISIYGMAVVLMPLGLYWTYKYYKSTDPIKKRIAWGSLIITLIALGITIVTTYNYVIALGDYLNNPQLNQLQML